MIISILKDINDDDKFSGTMLDVLENCIPVLALEKKTLTLKNYIDLRMIKRNKDLIELEKVV